MLPDSSAKGSITWVVLKGSPPTTQYVSDGYVVYRLFGFCGVWFLHLFQFCENKYL
jgi:hypothetical protein